MKEAKLIEMANKINKLEETMSLVISDLRNINSLAVGTLETIKRMPDYQEALDKLKEEAAKADEAAEKEKQKDETTRD